MSELNATEPARHAGPLVSVVMPCFNAAPYVSEALGSALGQTYGNVEAVVVDDGSTDGSVEIVSRLAAEHAGRIHLFHTARGGPYPARNVGLQHAKGELIAFLDADDWWLPGALGKLYGALVEHEADIAYCGWQNVGEGIRSAPYVPPAYEEGDPVAEFVRTCPWPIHAALVRREIVDRLGGFSERRYASMDYDFWLRALAITRRIKRVPEVMAFYRWHDLGQVSSVKWRQVLDALDAQQAFIRDNPGLVAHLSAERLHDLTEGQVLRRAYQALWKRDLVSAQKLFRHVARRGAYGLRDLGHVLSAVLPMPIYRGLIRLADRRPS
jgi:glycosyltransferase involved in cell wall biosynthesis